MISLGEKGAFIKYQNDYFQARIPKVTVVNPVGSGDSVVAGLATAILQKKSVENVIKGAMTTGVLNTMEAQTGFIDIVVGGAWHHSWTFCDFVLLWWTVIKNRNAMLSLWKAQRRVRSLFPNGIRDLTLRPKK